MQLRRRERGDTLIEVLFAIAVFSMVVVGSIAIMNVGIASAQRTLGLTVTRQVIDSQAQMLRLAHDSYIAQYSPSAPASSYTGAAATYATIETKYTVSKASNDIIGVTSCPTTFSGKPFYVYAGTSGGVSTIVVPSTALTANETPDTYPQVTDGSGAPKPEGIWIEAVKQGVNSTTPVGYIDFHINACWPGPGSAVPLTIGTIVRLYDPAKS